MAIIRDIVRQVTITAVTTLAIQLSTFAILVFAPTVLSDRDFAALVVIVAATMLSNTFFDLGLNQTATKFFSVNRDEEWFASANRIRLLCLPFASILALLTASLLAEPDIAAGIMCGAFLNLWNSIRTIDQARQNYLSFSRISIIFAGLRISVGGFALIVVRDPLAIAIGLYVIPVLAIRTSFSWPLLVKGLSHTKHSSLGMVAYATYVYINALVFVGLPYIPQFVIAERFGDLDAGKYGLILSCTAPISLLIYSLRSVLLPKMLHESKSIETAMWSLRGVLALAGVAILFCLCGVVVAQVLDRIYGQRFPGIGVGFLIFFTGFAVTSVFGFYSLSIHTMGVPHIAMWVSIAKTLLLVVLLVFQGHSLNQVIVITSSVMVSGELLLAAILFHARKSITR